MSYAKRIMESTEGLPPADALEAAKEADAKIAKLEARNAELAAAATDALSGWRYVRTRHGDLDGVGWGRVQQALEAALKDNPEPPLLDLVKAAREYCRVRPSVIDGPNSVRGKLDAALTKLPASVKGGA